MLRSWATSLTIMLSTVFTSQVLAFKVTATKSASPSSSNFPETAGVTPIPCHSHNDYLREHPLIDALKNGYISVEADIWQRDDMKDDLRIGHTEDSLRDDRTLGKMYVEPIVQRLQAANGGQRFLQGQWNGVFESNSSQTLVLLIDFKTSGQATWSTLMRALSPLRIGGWLSYWDIRQNRFLPGPITMVASGKATLDEVMQTTFTNSTSVRREVFLDAPLADLGSSNQYNTTNSYFASTDYAKVVDERAIQDQITAARKQQLVSRYWNTPDDRSEFQQVMIWQDFKREGVGIFNTDHLTTFRHWWTHQ